MGSTKNMPDFMGEDWSNDKVNAVNEFQKATTKNVNVPTPWEYGFVEKDIYSTPYVYSLLQYDAT